jgi:hypothetical protein
MLTLDTLLAAVRTALEQEAAEPKPASELVLWGVPGDETMKKLMAAKGGVIKIAVREAPVELLGGLSEPDVPVWTC